MNRRDDEAANQPPPKYDPNSNFCTVCINYGGKFNTGKDSKYIGGKKYALDYVQKDVLKLHILEHVVRNEDTKAPVRLYSHVEGGFVLMKDDTDIIRKYELELKSDRIVELYVDELEYCVGPERLVEHDISVEHFSGETSDTDYDGDDINCGDYGVDDDARFAENVDPDAEWFVRFPKECEGLDIDDCSEEDIVKSDIDLHSGRDSDGESKDRKFPMFSTSEIYDPSLKLGMGFPNKSLLREAIHSFAIKTHRNINIVKNDKLRVHAKCADKKCGWALHGLNVSGEPTFQIRYLNDTHSCAKSFKVKNMNAKWIAGKYKHKFKSDPKRDVKGFRVDAIEETRCDISHFQVYRAKRQAIDTIEGECSEQYTFLWDFAEEVKRCNPGSTVIVSTVEDENKDVRFDRFYMCLDALKKGFMSGCRPFLGFDGCHLKGPHEGVLLTAVGVDPNNNTYPLAIAVVLKESLDTWEWFLTLLKVDLNIDDDFLWTFMSDKQKGLVTSVQNVFPNANHRFCVRHLHENFKQAGYKGEDLKCALWKAAKATTENEFERSMDEMKALNSDAYTWLGKKPSQQWSRAYFNDTSRCDMLLNNGCETFNSCILEAREKPIVSMLEWILEYLMRRMQKNRDRANEKWKGSLCPKIQKIIDKGNDALTDCILIKSDAYHYQISCFDGFKYAVDLEKNTCGCRRWDLSGVPCKHALSTLYNEGLDYYDFTHACYRIDTYKDVYGHVIMPINGRHDWRPTGFCPLLPPNPGRDVGRPKTSRRRAEDEPSQKGKKKSRGKPKVQTDEHRLKRQQQTISCGLCGGEGHNKKYCPQVKSINRQQQEEINVSQYRVSQASENGASSSNLGIDLGLSNRPPKLKVKRKGCQSPPTPNHATRQSTKTWQTTLRSGKCFKTPPKPFEQLQECQVESGRKKKKKLISLSQLS